MTRFKHISTADAKALLDQDAASLADIRDQQSYLLSHIESAFHLHNDNLNDFINTTPIDKAVIVYCYHGNSSQGAAQFLVEKGFTEVYSMDGGFEVWRSEYATTSSQ